MSSLPAQATHRSDALFTGGSCWTGSVLLAIARSRSIESDSIPCVTTGLGAGFTREAVQWANEALVHA